MIPTSSGFALRRRGAVTYLEVEPFQATGRCHAAFSTRLGGVSQGVWAELNMSSIVGDEPAAVVENWRRFAGAVGFTLGAKVSAWQVHGSAVRVVGSQDPSSPEGEIGEYDALITQVAGPVLVVFVADCVPIYILDQIGGACGVVHAGWRGTLERAAEAALAGMAEAFGTNPSHCLAAIGPSIGPCCYEVSDAVAHLFREAYGERVLTRRENRWRLDLWAANRAGLTEAGIPEGRIFGGDICTACRRDLFFSHRADGGKTGRMAAVIWSGPTGNG